MIAGTGSGCGKTTLTCALLGALKNRGLKTAGFKAGPDYIDPMFHKKVIGDKSHNLDLFLCGESAVKRLLAEGSEGADFSLLEGVMGLYDGLGSGEECSSNALSLVTKTPTVLVLNPKGMSLSAAAEVSGFLNFRKNKIAGIILNGISEKVYNFYKNILEKETGVKVFGYLPNVKNAAFYSRHLGLVTAEEISDVKERLALLSAACEKSVDIDGLLEIASAAGRFFYEREVIPQTANIRIGVAKDTAFCFYYDDSLSLLEKLGARLVYFSPLADKSLPEDLAGLIFGGGYPEEYAEALSANTSLLAQIKLSAERKMPILAECGGFMYLSKQLSDRAGKAYKMSGVIDTEVKMTGGLSKFGYVTLTAEKDNLLCKAGEKIPAHEFHYSTSGNDGDAFLAAKENGAEWSTIHATETIFAGYPHIHMCGNSKIAINFLKKCEGYKYDI